MARLTLDEASLLKCAPGEHHCGAVASRFHALSQLAWWRSPHAIVGTARHRQRSL
ncbi:MAG: hypothetical protein ABSF27_07370 [Candidatus Dormibacteria bacterium]